LSITKGGVFSPILILTYSFRICQFFTGTAHQKRKSTDKYYRGLRWTGRLDYIPTRQLGLQTEL
jgi:hypothetical protein